MGYYMAGGYYAAGEAFTIPLHVGSRIGRGPAVIRGPSSSWSAATGIEAGPSHTPFVPSGVPDALSPGGHSRRRMNPLNPSAARRAIRRLTSFERIARRIVRFTSSRPVGRGHFMKKRRRRS